MAKRFDDVAGGTRALDAIDLEVRAGAFVAIVGPSGSGKSTLLRIVADLVPPSTGEVTVCGYSPSEARRRREYGIVFQTPVLYGWRTVTANVALPLEVAGIPAGERARRATEMLELVGLAEFGDGYPRQLSGGMQQRVAIARALAFQPHLLLMDEPFGALDELTRERLNSVLLRVWQETGVTVLFVTHHIEEAVFLADRVLVLTRRPGRIEADVTVALDRPRGEDTRLSPAFFDHVNRVRMALRSHGAADGVPQERR